MKILVNNIRRIGFIIFIIMIFVILSCSDDPSSPQDKEEDNPVVSVTIGTDGGTIETEKVSITIPAGAFNSNQDIAIFDVSDDQTFGDNAVSTSYKISGIPTDYSVPIKIKIQYSGELSGLSFIAVGNEVVDELRDITAIEYEFYNASDSSGYLLGELKPSSLPLQKIDNSSNIEDDFDAFLVAISRYRESETKNFKLKYPIIVEANIDELENIFEDAFGIVKTELGLNYDTPIEKRRIYIRKFDKAVRHSPYLGGKGRNYYVDAQKMLDSEMDEIKSSAVSSLIDSELDAFYFKEGTGARVRWMFNWLYYGILTWSEYIYSDNPNYKYPTKYEGLEMTPFNGMERGLDAMVSKQQHGYGMTPLLKYLTEDKHFGMAGIGNIYKYIENNVDITPTKAIINTMDALVVDWYPDFFKKYVNGEIYDIPINTFTSNVSNIWDIDDDLDTLKVFSTNDIGIDPYSDLSANMFLINLNHQPSDETYNLELSMDGPSGPDGLSLIIFGINTNGEAEYLETAHAQDFEIPNIKEYYDNNMRQFLAVLVNMNITSDDYFGTSNIDLIIKVNKQKDLADIPDISKVNRCTIVLRVLADEFTETKDGEQSNKITNVTLESNIIEGSFSGNTFTGTYSTTLFGGTTIEETVTVTVNDLHNIVTDVSWSSLKEYDTSYRGVEKTEKGFSGADIPLLSYDSYSNTINYTVTGESACNYITNAFSREENLFSIKLRSIQSYTCNDYSYVTVFFQQGY